ncbi:MAG: addiction module protein [Thermomonas sp.]|uniref:addiction module protein n=1 Tax=Thermomonas sp. TaxID=1971895 RepID=UPI0039E6CF68
MNAIAKNVLHDALRLPSLERAALIDGLIASLDRPDPELDALWLAEAEDRMAAYRAGALPAFDADEVFAGQGGSGA